MRSILTATKTVMCTAAFVAVVVPWTLAYCVGPQRLEQLLDRLLVWLVNQWPKG